MIATKQLGLQLFWPLGSGRKIVIRLFAVGPRTVLAIRRSQ